MNEKPIGQPKGLVRDKIPDSIARSGKIPLVKTLAGSELRAALLEKLLEEIAEFEEAPSVEELADIQEVLSATCREFGIAPELVERVRVAKRQERGGFDNHVYLETVMNPSVECEFCREFESHVSPVLRPSQSRFLLETDSFVAFPALGSFVEGYVLVCPREHLPSCACLGQAGLALLGGTMKKVRHALSREYSPPVVYEHGSSQCGLRAGACVDHAHLHVIPTTVTLVDELFAEFNGVGLRDWEELERWTGRPYLLYQTQEDALFCFDVDSTLPSQFLRKKIASALGLTDRWDWGAYLGIPEMLATLARLRGQLS